MLRIVHWYAVLCYHSAVHRIAAALFLALSLASTEAHAANPFRRLGAWLASVARSCGQGLAALRSSPDDDWRAFQKALKHPDAPEVARSFARIDATTSRVLSQHLRLIGDSPAAILTRLSGRFPEVRDEFDFNKVGRFLWNHIWEERAKAGSLTLEEVLDIREASFLRMQSLAEELHGRGWKFTFGTTPLAEAAPFVVDTERKHVTFFVEPRAEPLPYLAAQALLLAAEHELRENPETHARMRSGTAPAVARLQELGDKRSAEFREASVVLYRFAYSQAAELIELYGAIVDEVPCLATPLLDSHRNFEDSPDPFAQARQRIVAKMEKAGTLPPGTAGALGDLKPLFYSTWLLEDGPP